jgi:hypothetical protein
MPQGCTPITNEVQISEFNWDPWMKHRNPFIIIAGARGSGKSVMIKDIVHRYHLANLPRCVIFSQTEGASGFFSDFVPGIFIHCPITIRDITEVWEAQKELVLKQKVGQIGADVDIRLLIVVDDAAYNKKLIACQALREVAMNGRHSHVILVMSIQYLNDLQSAMRDSADIAIFLSDSSQKARQRIYEQFCSCFPKFKAFNTAFDMCTADNDSFVVNRKSGSNDISKCISYYKAKYGIKFKFGPASLWNYHNQNFMSETDEYLYKQRMAENSSRVALSAQDSITITRM